MKADEKVRLVSLYEDRFKTQGASIQTLGWNSTEDQQLRFRVLTEIRDLTSKNVCDVGCGFGDLFGYLGRRFAGIQYTGIDIVPSLVSEARCRYPTARFLQQDILDESFDERFDYLLLSGALSFRISDNLSYSHAVMSRMFALCNQGIGLNFLSTYVNFQRAHNYHHDPQQILAFAKTLTQWVTLRHDYPLWEFTVFLYKQPQMAFV